MLNDISNYLIFDILTKVDRATIVNQLKGIPFLDKEIFKFSWTILMN